MRDTRLSILSRNTQDFLIICAVTMKIMTGRVLKWRLLE